MNFRAAAWALKRLPVDALVKCQRRIEELALTHLIKPMPGRLRPLLQKRIDFSGIVSLPVFKAMGGL